MITDDEIMALFAQADPARDDDGPRMVDPAGYLDALQARSYDMQLIETPEAPTKTPRDNRWVRAAIIAAAIVLIVAGAVILTRNDGQEAPATPQPTNAPIQPTIAPTEPTTPADATAVQSVEEAIAVVRSFTDAQNAHDADLALSFLADQATVPAWGQGRAQPKPIQGPDEYRLENENAASTNTQRLLSDCAAVDAQGPGTTLRCAFTSQDMRSDELGLGPYSGPFLDVMVVDGKITSIVDSADPGEPNGSVNFEQEMWDPFQGWVSAHYPDDAAVMYASDTPTPASIALWDEHTREYVGLRLAAERAAAQFLDAFGAFDADAAGAQLAPGATTNRIVTEDVQDYTQAIELYQAWGYEQQLGSCRQIDGTATGMRVRCPFAYQLLGSGELGLGPFEGSYFDVTVDGATGLITDVANAWRGEDFVREVGDPFITWVTTTYPDDEAVMSADGGPSLTPESLALWAQHRQEYVQHVLDGTPTTTTG